MPRIQDMSDRMLVWFAEADFEIGFSLVDMAQAEAAAGNYAQAAQILINADNVFLDIQQILCKLRMPDGGPFRPLVGELRRAIDLANSG
ncbi:MAG: hypothetical protein QOJ99_2361 [Bryobacterales bacterium]|jgi:hypothetical protein|nr:hypothetical protein [Bryobacterales bacterium]